MISVKVVLCPSYIVESAVFCAGWVSIRMRKKSCCFVMWIIGHKLVSTTMSRDIASSLPNQTVLLLVIVICWDGVR